MSTITYKELADRLDNIFLFNQAINIDPDFYYEGLENGRQDYCYIHDNGTSCPDSNEECEYENYEIYQWYLIDSVSADYLKQHTEELVFWSDVLQEHIWGITHFGTAWDGVDLEFIEEKEDKQ